MGARAQFRAARQPSDTVESAYQSRAVPSPADEPRSDHIAHYRILGELGRGGQATVYLAEDTRLHRQVALKVIDVAPGARSQAIDRFRREAEITSKLDHPGICQVHEIGQDRDVLYIAMRYIEGDTLANRIAADSSVGDESLAVNLDSASEAATTPSEPLAAERVARSVTPSKITRC